MKRPIDPSLTDFNDDDILMGIEQSDKPISKTGFDFANPTDKLPEVIHDPRFVVSEKEQTASSTREHSHHHHSDDGSHHHHSDDGSHHHHSGSSSHHHHSGNGSHHHHHHSSHNKKKKSKLPVPAKIAIAFFAIILAIILLVVGTFGVLRYMGKNDVMPTLSDDVQYSETIEYNGHTYKYNENVFAIGFIGIDQEELETSENTDFVGAADTDMVICVDTSTGKASVITIPRDTMVDIDMYSESGVFLRSEKAQLCLAYAYGDGADKSCRNSIEAMRRVLYNVPIQKYFALDLNGIAPLNDAIGGVTVKSIHNFKHLGIKEGDTVTLKGELAQEYVRSRDMNDIEASLNRVQRQNQYISAYAQQLLPAVVKDFSVISKLYSTAQDYSRTNLSLSNATYIASLLLSKGVTSFDTYTISGEMKAADDPLLPNVVHAELYADDDSIMQALINTFYTQID